MRAHPLSSLDQNVSFRELSTFGQQWFTSNSGQGIRKTIFKVKGSGVSAFSIFSPCETGNFSLLCIKGYDLNIRAHYE